MPDEKIKPIPVPVDAGVEVPVHRKRKDGSHEERAIPVKRGRLCSHWFKVLTNEDGHYDLYQADPKKEPELRGAPQLCGMADHASALGWKWGPAPKPEPKPLAAPKASPPKPTRAK